MAFARLEELGKRKQGALSDPPDIPWRPRWQDNADLFLERLDEHCCYINGCVKDLAEKFRLLTSLEERLQQIEQEKDAPAGEVMRSEGNIDAAFAVLVALDDEARSLRQLAGAMEQAILLRFANLKLAFCPQDSTSKPHPDLEAQIRFAKDIVACGGANTQDAAARVETLGAQAKTEKKIWDKIRRRRGLYLRTLFEGHVSGLLAGFINDTEQRNSIAHADERIDYGAYNVLHWRWAHHGSIDAITAALAQLADVADGICFAIHKYRNRLRKRREEA